jgi:hypothetical protein
MSWGDVSGAGLLKARTSVVRRGGIGTPGSMSVRPPLCRPPVRTGPMRSYEGRGPGLWVSQSRRRWPAFTTAITKHSRSVPRLGNGFPVYFTEIGSMYRQP